MVGQEHVIVANLNLLTDFGQRAVVDFGIRGSLHIRVGAIEPPRHGDILRLHTHLDECGACLDGFPQVGVTLVETIGVGTSRLGEHGVGDGRHRAVIGTPATVTGIQVNTDLVGCLSLHHACCHDGGYGK